MTTPWLEIPAADYEAHMDAVGQSAALRESFARVYAQRRPRRLAALGCTTGGDLALVDPAVTERIVGVDVNADYLVIARQRLAAFGPRLELVCGDVLEVTLAPASFELVHAALLLEYVDPAALFERMHAWLTPDGVCSVITQEPTPGALVIGAGASGTTSLERLADHMTLLDAARVTALADRASFILVERRTKRLPNGKSLTSSIFEKEGAGDHD